MKRPFLFLLVCLSLAALCGVLSANAALYLHCNSIDSSTVTVKQKLDHAQTQVDLIPRIDGDHRKHLLSSADKLLEEVGKEATEIEYSRMAAVVRHCKWPFLLSREYFKDRLVASDRSLLHVWTRMEALKAIKSQYQPPSE